MFSKVFTILIVAWPVSEVILGLLLRAKRESAAVRDRGSLALLWVTIAAGLTAGHFIRAGGPGSVGASPAVYLTAASALIVCGLALRWAAIITLGRFFTTNVAVLPGHAVVRTGVYRYMRHPAYSGLLVAFLGSGVAFNNWLSLLVIVVPIAAALSYRIHVEEAALVEALGNEYVDYCKVTKRLIPGIY